MKYLGQFLICFFIFHTNIYPQEPNIKQKIRDAQLLVKMAVEYLETNELHAACHTFSKDPTWRKGDLSITLIRTDGTIYTNPDDRFSIWSNITDTKTDDSESVLNQMMHRSMEGGGWVSYPWKHDLKYAYVERFKTDSEHFFVTAGFYPISKEFHAKLLVTDLIDLFGDLGTEKALEKVSTPKYQRGLIHLEVYKDDGTCVAHGTDKSCLGKNLMHLKDKKGVNVLKEASKIIESKKKGWITYTWKNANKRSYVKGYTDPQTQQKYIILAGYYPDINKNTVPKFVKDAASYFSFNGKNKAIKAFNDKNGIFHQGSLEIILLDSKGKILTNTYPNNTLDKVFFKRVMKKGEEEGAGWVYGVDRYADIAAYVDKATLEGKNYFITSIQHIVSKKRVTEHFVNEAAHFLENHTAYEAFKVFSDQDGPFYRGDQYLFVYNMEGRCLAHGDNTDFIQRNFYSITDQKGNPMLEQLISLARKSQIGWTSFHLRNTIRYTYIRRVEKTIGKKQESFIIGSGFWG